MSSAILKTSETSNIYIDGPDEDEFQHYILAFGNGTYENMSGNDLVPSRKSFDIFAMWSRAKRNISVINVDEI